MPISETYHRQSLTNFFGQMSNEQINQIFANTKIFDFEAGEYIFKQGDTQNALYIVLSGRLRVLYQNGSDTQILGDVSAGEPVGELALFTKEPRSASVMALRKSVVLQLNEADYLALVDKFPQFAHTLTHLIIKRLRLNSFQKRTGANIKNIAIVKLQPNFDLSSWTDAIKKQLALMAANINIYDHHAQANSSSQELFDTIENNEGLNFLVCDEQHPDWANQCISYCDLVLVVSDFYSSSDICSIEEKLKLYEAGILHKKIYLLLLHPENAPKPSNTQRWLKDRSIDLHLHIRRNNNKDIRRFCRIITNRAVGLVLGGGGAKGFAHIGAAKALMESGIEFDFVGGTSAGALYGMGLTFTDFNLAEITNLCQKGAEKKVTSNDYHLPFVSLMTGKKMRSLLKSMFGEIHLDDFWVNTYCVSTNYSTASMKIHETGLARQQLEASIAIPGVFPPVVIDRHLHVDGGVMDNLPIETMYQKPVAHVIAISLSAQAPHLVDIEKVPTAWQILVNTFTKKHRYRLPKMASLLINSLTLNSVKKQAIKKSEVAIYLEMDLKKFGFLDWSKWKELIEKGYQETQTFLKEMPKNEQFWR